MVQASSSGTVASDPTANPATPGYDPNAATTPPADVISGAGTTTTAATPGVTDTGASFPAINPQIVDPSYQLGTVSQSWWGGLQTFMEAVQRAYADQARSAVPEVPGQAATSGGGSERRDLTVETGPHANLLHPGRAGAGQDQIKTGVTTRQPGEPGTPAVTRGQIDMEAVRQAARAVGIVIPNNVTSVAQLGQVRVPPALRSELTQAGLNPGAMATVGTLSSQTLPLDRESTQAYTAADLYNQFQKAWGSTGGTFSQQWTRDLINAGLLDPAAVNGSGIGNADAVGNAYQVLLGYSIKNKMSPAQALAQLQSLPANRNKLTETGLAVDAQQGAQSVFYSYGINPSTQTVQNIVSQTMSAGLSSPYEIDRQARALATQQALQWSKTMFPGVADQLTADQSLQQVAQPWLQQAAQMLGVNPDTINMTDPKWQKAINGGQGGTQMTMDEWSKTLASDPQYGYQYSQTAQDRASSMGMAIRSMFGLQGPSSADSFNYSSATVGG